MPLCESVQFCTKKNCMNVKIQAYRQSLALQFVCIEYGTLGKFVLSFWSYDFSLSLCHCGNPFICLFFTYAPSSKTYLYYLSKRKRKFTIEWVQKHLSRMIKILFVEIQLSTKCLFGVQLLASNMRAMLLHATGFTNNLMKTVNTEGYMNLIRM